MPRENRNTMRIVSVLLPRHVKKKISISRVCGMRHIRARTAARNPLVHIIHCAVQAARNTVDAAWRPMHHILASITRRGVCSGCHARRASHAAGRQAATQEGLINNGIIIRSSGSRHNVVNMQRRSGFCLLAPARQLVPFLPHPVWCITCTRVILVDRVLISVQERVSHGV